MRRRRRWVVVFALTLTMALAHSRARAAGERVAIDEQGPVVLVDAGRPPRRPLRYKGGDNIQQTTTATMEMAILEPPGQPSTDMKFTMLTSQTSAPGGRVRVTFRVSDLEMTMGGNKVPDAARARIKQLLGATKAEVVVNERGLPESVNVDIDESVPAEARTIMEQYVSAMKASVVAFPEEPVGAGAKWRQQLNARSNSVKIVNEATYELREVKDDALVIARKDVQSAPRQPMPFPGGGSGELMSLAGAGQSTMAVDLRAYLPTRRESSLEITMRIKTKGQAIGTMKMSTTINSTSVTKQGPAGATPAATSPSRPPAPSDRR